MLSLKNLLLILFIIFFRCNLVYSIQSNGNVSIKELSYIEDKNNKLTLDDIFASSSFKKTQLIPNFNLSNSTFWLKLNVQNNTNDKDLLLNIQNSSLSSVALYELNNVNRNIIAGERIPFSKRIFHSPTPLFKLEISPNSYKQYLIKVSSSNVIQLPIVVGTTYNVLALITFNQYIFGIYIGIMFVMFFYNLFIYVTVKDSNYLFYVIYILTIAITQACLKGYAGKFLWPENTWLIIHAQIVIIGLSGISSVMFASKFLDAKHNSPFFYKLCFGFIAGDLIGIALTLCKYYIIAQQVFQFVNGIESILIIVFGIMIYKNGYKPALFLNISWSFFLGGVIVYILKDVGVLNYNTYTSNSILIGSALEAILLSFALADKINDYKKEKELSQAQALAALEENARIIKEQNVTLERKVEERTTELVAANEDIKRTLTELKEAEAQLVEAEKMASLGQLTAGIAHEINNPINFVTSNVAPLRRDVDMLVDAINVIESVGLSDDSLAEKQQQIEDYKEEIDLDFLKIEINHLLNGINEGATRTADIVKGLKIFSRLDEDDIKKANINDGLESTLIIANNMIGNKIKVIKNLSKSIPLIDCYPGKLNQVFLNIISNAVFAINDKFNNQPGGFLKITTEYNDENLLVKIEDNGSGMSEKTKKKIYEPFFTTKEVGVGTGLGMSIVYNTIKKHNAQIYLNSEEGVGTEFIIELPLTLKEFITDYTSEQNG